ncbi:MAG: antitoxin MazE-like protein [Gammaproteobacteria bacterium]
MRDSQKWPRRMKAMRERRRARGLRELRLVVPDVRSKAVQKRISKQVVGLDRSRESEALWWTESVSEFDAQ